jgi:hypothetical protein
VSAQKTKSHEPGEPHQYDLTCRLCGQKGTVSVAVEPQYAPPAVERGHNHTTGGLPTYPVFRDACPLGCDAVRAGEIAANAGRRPNLAVVDPFAESAAMLAVSESSR